MIGLIASVSVVLAASSLSCDHVAHLGSFSSTSSRTFVSTRIIELDAARQRENLLCLHAHCRSTTQLGEFAGSRLRAWASGAESNLAAIETFESYRCAGFETEVVADLFGNGDLTFTGEIRCHEVLPRYTWCYFNGLPLRSHGPKAHLEMANSVQEVSYR